jgi:hypothetical protein
VKARVEGEDESEGALSGEDGRTFEWEGTSDHRLQAHLDECERDALEHTEAHQARDEGRLTHMHPPSASASARRISTR